MIIVIEGPDGAGKTTLAKEFMRRLGDRGAYMRDRRRSWQFANDTAILRRAVRTLAQGRVAVIDRHWVGEGIYGAVFRDGGGAWTRRLDSALLRYGATYVLAAPPVDALEAEFQKLRGQRPELFTSMREVATRYLDLWHGSVVRPTDGNYVELLSALYPWSRTRAREAMLYDRFSLNGPLIGWVHTFLYKMLERHRELRAADPLSHGEWELSGSLLTCRALLVGERARHPNASVNWPFYWGDRESAGHLNRALHLAKIDERDVALTNAFNAVDGRVDNLRRVLNWLVDNRPEVPIIALGGKAFIAVESLGHRCDDLLKHPQWERRFNHGGVANYAAQLERVVYGAARAA